MAEAARADADAIDAAGAGISAAMRADTIDADGAGALLHLVSESMKAKLDALVEAIGATC